MKGLRPYSLGDQSRSRMHGTKVTLAGRPAFLPNHDVPIVVQQLTKGQIEAIPKDRFTVSMVSRPGNILFAPSEHGGGAHSDSLGHIVVDLHKKQARQMFASNYRFSNTAYMNGSNYMFGLQVGATYKVLENLALYLGIRGVYATGNYNGYVQDVMYSTDGGNNYTYASENGTQQLAGQTVEVNGRNTTLSMNCDQTGFGVTPVLGINWYINKYWNLAAKYEFKTKIRMKNTTRMNEYTQTLVDPSSPNYSNTLAAFADGKKVADDIPGYLALGAQYSPKENIRIGLAYHWFQDKSANKGTAEVTNPIDGSTSIVDKRDLIDHDTHEVLAGIEWMCHKRLTVSASWQKTMYGVSDQYMNDISFCCSSNSLGCGVRIHASRLFNIDLGYMHTFYKDRTVNTPTAVGVKTDVYNRHNDVIGVGLNFAW